MVRAELRQAAASSKDRVPRVIVHVGLPKTGTSFLQNLLVGNRELLADRGVHIPARSRAEMFAAALAMSGRTYSWDPVGIDPAEAWRSVLAQVSATSATSGTSVISSEWLCTAKPTDAARVRAELSAAGAEVHVVVTVRDLVRQLPAEWQEGVKHGRSLPFGEFLRSVLEDEGNPALHRRFWRAQDPIDVLDRWASDLPPEQVHVVVSPPAGAPGELLWERFAAVLGIDPTGVPMPEREINTSLGHLEVELLRRVNRSFPRGGRERVYREVVKRFYASRVLAGAASARARLPAAYAEVVAARVAGWQAELGRRGYAVHGDLAELVGEPVGGPEAVVTPVLLLARSVTATGRLLEEIDRLRVENAELRAVVADHVGSPWVRLRNRLARTHRVGGSGPDDADPPEHPERS